MDDGPTQPLPRRSRSSAMQCIHHHFKISQISRETPRASVRILWRTIGIVGKYPSTPRGTDMQDNSALAPLLDMDTDMQSSDLRRTTVIPSQWADADPATMFGAKVAAAGNDHSRLVSARIPSRPPAASWDGSHRHPSALCHSRIVAESEFPDLQPAEALTTGHRRASVDGGGTCTSASPAPLPCTELFHGGSGARGSDLGSVADTPRSRRHARHEAMEGWRPSDGTTAVMMPDLPLHGEEVVRVPPGDSGSLRRGMRRLLCFLRQ